MSGETICPVVDTEGRACDRPVRVKGLCNMHNQRRRRGMSLTTPMRTPQAECSVDGCHRRNTAFGLCQTHDLRRRKGTPLDAPVMPRGIRGTVRCAVDGCERLYHQNGLCRAHGDRRRAYKLTLAQLNEFEASSCEVCGSRENLHIDHDHSCCPGSRTCGRCVRGLLCQGCNHAAGKLRDDPVRIRALADYLERRAS